MSPHMIGAVMDAIEAMWVALGPGVLLSYVLQGLFHPARKVREVNWRIYNRGSAIACTWMNGLLKNTRTRWVVLPLLRVPLPTWWV